MGPLGPGSRVSGLEAPGNGCSGGTGGKKGPERWVQSAGREGGGGGAKDARLGGWSWRLPRRQQGPSWQGPGREPRPGERARGGEIRRDPPFSTHFPFLFLETSSPHCAPSCLLRLESISWGQPGCALHGPRPLLGAPMDCGIVTSCRSVSPAQPRGDRPAALSLDPAPLGA